MRDFEEFVLPLAGMHEHRYSYCFELDKRFFSGFEGASIDQCSIKVELDLQRDPDLMVLDFTIGGWFATDCDRCLADIQMPIEGRHQLLVKYGEENFEGEVVFLSRDRSEWNISQFVYEFCSLSLPMTRIYDCESEEERPCNTELLQKLTKEDTQTDSSVWDKLKELDLN